MQKKSRLVPLMVCISMAIHGVILFTLSVSTGGTGVQGPPRSLQAFSLVNLTPMEPAAPEPPPPPAQTPPPRQMPPRAVPLELPPEPSEPAENFIPLEEPGSTAEIAAPPVPGELSKTPEESAAETAAYVKRNYDYIQRRIRGTLEYPIQALRAGAQGVVEVSFILHKDGGVSEVGIAASSGFELLDAAAMEAIYAAAPFRRPPAEVRMVIPVAFRLR